jgi:Fic family protein
MEPLIPEASREKLADLTCVPSPVVRTRAADLVREMNSYYSNLIEGHQTLPQILARFEEAYASKAILATDQLVALAAAHHRLTWIHPFGDGNGRVTRLYSHAWLVRAGG